MYCFIYKVLDGLWIEKVYFLNFLILIIEKKNVDLVLSLYVWVSVVFIILVYIIGIWC